MVTLRPALSFRGRGLLLAATLMLVIVSCTDVVFSHFVTNIGMTDLARASTMVSHGEPASSRSLSVHRAVEMLEYANTGSRTDFWLGYAYLLDDRPREAIVRWQTVRSMAVQTLIQYEKNSTKFIAARPPKQDWLGLASEVDPDSANVDLHLGRREEDRSNWAAAIAYYERSAQNDLPTTGGEVRADAYHHASQILANRLSEPEKAETYAKAAISLDAKHVDARIGLGDIYFRTGRHVEAIAQYMAAIELEPAQFESRYQLGRALIALERFDEAMEQLEMARSLYHRDPWLSLQLGDAYREAGLHVQAKELYQQVIQLAPTDRVAEIAAEYLDSLERQK